MEKDAKVLIDKYINGRCTQEEAVIVEKWYYQMDDQVEFDENRIDEIGQRIWNELPLRPRKSAFFRLWPRLVAAMVLLVAGTFFVLEYGVNKRKSTNVYVNDIAPGKNRAVLTLDNGKTIDLNDSKKGIVIDLHGFNYEDGSAVALDSNSARQARLLNLSTPLGGTYQVILPDGSKVWLNAGSKLSFPASFEQAKTRRVELIGEAYFEIKKQYNSLTKQRLPFLVISGKQEVAVLGTHFNVDCYDDEQAIRTTLLEGSVSVSVASGQSVLLKPNQQSIWGKQHFAVQQVDAEEIASWKDGYFRFNDEALESVMQKVARWYDVNVVFTDNTLKTEVYAALTTRFANVSRLLDKLEQTGAAKFRIAGRTITVSRK